MTGQLKSHLIPKLYVPGIEEATGLLVSDVVPGGAGDESFVMSIAGNIKRRVCMFSFNINSKEDNFHFSLSKHSNSLPSRLHYHPYLSCSTAIDR